MGRRDEPELTPSDGELAEAEGATRELLARYGEPAPAQPPPGLVGRVLAAMPQASPGRDRRPWWGLPRPLAAWALGAVAALLILVGGLTALAGAPLAGAPLGPGILGSLREILATRPLGALAAPLPGLLLMALGVAVAALAWWGLHRRR